MDSNTKMDFLCPHCKYANQSRLDCLPASQPQSVECNRCLRKFEIIVAKGLNGDHNVIVDDLALAQVKVS